jgi:hypothetical protein
MFVIPVVEPCQGVFRYAVVIPHNRYDKSDGHENHVDIVGANWVEIPALRADIAVEVAAATQVAGGLYSQSYLKYSVRSSAGWFRKTD